MRLVEIVEGIETSPESMAAAASFAASDPQDRDPLRRRARLRRQPRADLRGQRAVARAGGAGLDVGALDEAVAESGAAPIGPFALADMLGLDTVLHVAEHLHEAFGERFHVHAGMRELVAKGELGVKTGRGFYESGAPRTAGSEPGDVAELVERFALKALVECCLLLEEGVASARDIDVGADGRRRPDPAALRARRRSGARRGARAPRAGRRALGRGFLAADDPAPAGRPGPPRRREPARASSRRRGPTPARASHRSSSSPAASWRSPGSTTRRPTRSRSR